MDGLAKTYPVLLGFYKNPSFLLGTFLSYPAFFGMGSLKF